MNSKAFDYSEPAELYGGNTWTGGPSAIKYRRFDTAAQAIRYAMEVLTGPSSRACVMEVDEDRFNHLEIRQLYESSDYPLPRQTGKDTDAKKA